MGKLIEFDASQASGSAFPVRINGTEYSIQPLRAKDWGALKARMRSRILADIAACREIDPMGKRHVLSMAASRPINVQDLLDELMTPDVAVHVVTQQLRVHHPEVTQEFVEEHCDTVGLVKLLAEISGLASEEVEDDAAKNPPAPICLTGGAAPGSTS